MIYNNNSKLWLPEAKSWRIYKFILSNGRFIQLNKIRCIRELREYLIKYQPIDVYYSASCFRNPINVTTKQKLKKYDMLSWDLVFDIDENPVIEAKKLIDYMKQNYKLNPDYILVTNRGFQIVYYKNDLLRDELLEQLDKAGIKIDKDITTDFMRVIRLPLTYMSKSKRIAKFISKDYLYSLLVESQSIPIPRGKGNTIKREGDERKARSPSGGKARPTISAPPISICKYISNRVEGTERYVLYLQYYKKWDYVKEELLSLGNEYKIPYFYIIDYEDYIGVISLKTFDLKRIEKIYSKSSSFNAVNFFRFKRVYIPVSAEILMQQKVGDNATAKIVKIRRKPELKFTKGMPNKAKDYSFPHSKWLETLGAQILDKEETSNKVGKEPKVVLSKKIMRNLIL